MSHESELFQPCQPTELISAADSLPAQLRRELAAEWSLAAQFEHASIASFGRFALELLALAAPPQLVAAAHQAALDEIRHAQWCFGLASVYAKTSLGPGALAIDPSAFGQFELHGAVRAAVLEGCVGETLAAQEAEYASALCRIPAISATLSAIAREESAHAALAYRFVSWALHSHGPALQVTVDAAFASARQSMHALEPPPRAADGDAWTAHGRLSQAERYAVRMRALHELVDPLARELTRGA